MRTPHRKCERPLTLPLAYAPRGILRAFQQGAAEPSARGALLIGGVRPSEMSHHPEYRPPLNIAGSWTRLIIDFASYPSPALMGQRGAASLPHLSGLFSRISAPTWTLGRVGQQLALTDPRKRDNDFFKQELTSQVEQRNNALLYSFGLFCAHLFLVVSGWTESARTPRR